MSNEPELAGQTVVVIGGRAGIGLETARRARAARGARRRCGTPRRRRPSLPVAPGRSGRVEQGAPEGTLLFMGATGGRRTAVGLALISALTAALPVDPEMILELQALVGRVARRLTT